MKKPHFNNNIDTNIVVKDSANTNGDSPDTLDMELDGVPDFIDSNVVEKSINVGLSPVNDVRTFTNHHNNSSNSNTSDVEIVDNTVIGTSEGVVAYSVPNEMKVNNRYIIKVRITKDNSESGKTVLVIGDRHIPINDETVDSKVTIENIKVDDEMTAEILYDTSFFYITQLNTKLQNVDSLGYTEWSWQVTPLKSGKGYLKLIIKIKSADKDIVVFDKAIEVKSNIGYSIKEFISNYWQWLMTTIIIPLIVFFYKKKKKKKKKVA